VRLATAVVLFAIMSTAQAQAPTIHGAMTVNDFSVQCQHSALKSAPQARIDACVAWLKSSAEAMGAANQTAGCWSDLKEHAAPMVIADGLYYLATIPTSRKEPLAAATREVILIAAKRCK
jgi:hypothetical protein